MSGSELSNYNGLQVLEAPSASELADLIARQRAIIHIVQIYSDGKKHYAFITSSRKLKLIKEN